MTYYDGLASADYIGPNEPDPCDPDDLPPIRDGLIAIEPAIDELADVVESPYMWRYPTPQELVDAAGGRTFVLTLHEIDPDTPNAGRGYQLSAADLNDAEKLRRLLQNAVGEFPSETLDRNFSRCPICLTWPAAW